MQRFEFVREYEAGMSKMKMQPPVISATSEMGILDYKRAVAELTALWKNIN